MNKDQARVKDANGKGQNSKNREANGNVQKKTGVPHDDIGNLKEMPKKSPDR